MSNWFFYHENRRFGPVSSEKLRSLALEGRISAETTIESEDGRRVTAGRVKGLVFGSQSVVINTAKEATETKTKRKINGFTPEWNRGTWTIVVAAGVAAVSFFMPWRAIGPLSVNAFRNGAFLLGLFFAYPVWASVSGRSVNRVGGMACGILGLVLGLIFIAGSQVTFFGESMNIAATGVYVFLAACVVLTVGVFIHRYSENASVIVPIIGIIIIAMIFATYVYFSISGEQKQEQRDPFSKNFVGGDEDTTSFSDEMQAKKSTPHEEINILKKEKADWGRVKGFAVENAKFYYHKGMSTEAVIELDIRNDSREAIAKFSLNAKLTSHGRSVPWVEDGISYQIPGGLEPDESQNLKLKAGFGWEIAPKDREDYVLQVTVKSIEFANGEEVKVKEFTKDDEKKLQKLIQE